MQTLQEERTDYMTGDLGLLMFNFRNLGTTDSRQPSLRVSGEVQNYLRVFAHMHFQLSG